MSKDDLMPDDMSNLYSRKAKDKHISHLQGYIPPSGSTKTLNTALVTTSPTCNIDDTGKGIVVGYKSPGGSTTSPACDISEVSKGEIIGYKSPASEVSKASCDPCADYTNGLLEQIIQLLTDIQTNLSSTSPSGSWYEFNGVTSVATPPDAINPYQDPNQITDGIKPGYNVGDVNNQLHGRNAPDLWIVNDGPKNSMYIITSSDGKSFSPEFQVGNGERRLIHDVYEFRFRSAVAGNALRASEREIVAPYVSIVTSTITPVGTANEPNFTTNSVIAIIGGTPLTLVSIPIPNGFSIVVRANVDNGGATRVYLANSIANTGIAANRVTLAPGDSVSLTISDVNKIFVRGSTGVEVVDWIVEQP